MASLHDWLHETLRSLSQKSALAEAIRYALKLWAALIRYASDGRVEIDNNAAERALRTVALGQQPGGSSVALQAVWFARVQGLSVQACHAVVYSVQPRPEVAEAFFAGLVLQ